MGITPVILLVALCGAQAAHSQVAETELTGRVIASGTGQPVRYVSVTVEGTALGAMTDSLGRWTLRRVPPGPQVLLARRIGFAPSRNPVIVPTAGSLTVEIEIATNALLLGQLSVTADRAGRVRGEVGTTTVIDQDAIANQIAASLQGILELLPGVALQPPGLDAAAQFALRTLPQLSSTGATSVGAAGTLITIDGVPLSNNANLQTIGVRGEINPVASTAGGGIDLRSIPATTLDRVEVIRSVPSVRWGDLTQGAVIVETRAAAVPPRLVAKFDPRTTAATLVGGRAWRDDQQAVTASFDLTRTRADQTLSSASTVRAAGQIAYRLQLGDTPRNGRTPDDRAAVPRASFDTRVDWWQLRFDSPERVDLEPGRNSFQNDRGLRFAERARLPLWKGMIDWTLSYDLQTQLTRESRSLAHPTSPFTDRLTEGRNIGSYVEGQYDGSYQLDGAPRMLYSRIEWECSPLRRFLGVDVTHLRAGAELRREWNSGSGYSFDISRPPQASMFNGVNGFDRPRRFDVIPPLVTSTAYADVRLAATRGRMTAAVQPGVRVDVLHDGSWWLSGARSTSLQPRVSAELAPRPWLRVLGGAGVVAKVPTIAQLSPAPQYFDVVNVNRYTPDPRERLAVLTTFIRDPSNPGLGFSRGVKQEVGIELDGGQRRGMVTVTWFNDNVRGAVTNRRDLLTVFRDRYALADTGRGTGQPGRILDPPIATDTMPAFLDRWVNGGHLRNNGVEFTVNFPVVPALRTRLQVSGSRTTTRFATSDRDYGNVLVTNGFQVDTTVKRLAYFEGASDRARRGLLTWRLTHHQPRVGLVVTFTVQQRIGDERTVLGDVDSLSFAGYVTRAGRVVPVPRADRLLPEYADLRRARADFTPRTSRQPDDWALALTVAKSVGARGRLSFYVYNALDKLAVFGAAGAVRQLPDSRFGAELTLPFDDVVGRWW